MTVVLLWDLDGTLLTTGRAGVFALEAALAEVCGVERSLQELPTGGLTDAQVAALALESCGREADPETISAFIGVYEQHLPASLHRRQGSVLPGVREVLEDLADEPGVVSLLLTGNTSAGAAAKLAHYELESFFDGGGFCAGPGEREEIARRAIELARERAADSTSDRTFVIGDTPHDVRCGRAVGARTIALASGSYSPGDLAACDPWLVLERLPEPPVFRRLIGIDE